MFSALRSMFTWREVHADVQCEIQDHIVVLDVSPSMRGEGNKGSIAFLRNLIFDLQPHQRFSLIAFSKSMTTVHPLSSAFGFKTCPFSYVPDIRDKCGLGSSTSLRDSVNHAIDSVEGNNETLITVVTDGLDNSSSMTQEEFNAKLQRLPDHIHVKFVCVGLNAWEQQKFGQMTEGSKCEVINVVSHVAFAAGAATIASLAYANRDKIKAAWNNRKRR